MKILLFTIMVFSILSCAGKQVVTTEMAHSKARLILINNGYLDITDKHNLAFVSGHSLWLSSDNTAVLIILYDPLPHANIYQMTIGSKGMGFKNWSSQKRQDIKVLK